MATTTLKTFVSKQNTDAINEASFLIDYATIFKKTHALKSPPRLPPLPITSFDILN